MGLEDDQLDELMYNELLKYAQFIHRFKPSLLRLSRLNIIRKSRTYDFGYINMWNRSCDGISDFEIIIPNKPSLFYLRTHFDGRFRNVGTFKTFFGVNITLTCSETPINLDGMCLTLAKIVNESTHYNTALMLGLIEFNSVSDQIYNEFCDFVHDKWEEEFGPSLKFDGKDLFLYND